MSPVGEKVADRRTLTTEPGVEVPGTEDSSEGARERGSRRAGLLLVIFGVVLMSLAAEASAVEGGAPEPPASGETRLESSGHHQ